jgi:tRNA U34 5-carboxymethylaminomethyl modifying enzyme MnmG/GidA
LEHLQKEMDVKLPDNLDYLKMPQLGMELRERLHEYKPKNLSAAAK